MRLCHVSTFPPPIMKFICNQFLIMIPIDTISPIISAPLLKYYYSTIYDYNTITYNLIKIHIHQLFIFSSYVFHFE
jgi:hypothetical protein